MKVIFFCRPDAFKSFINHISSYSVHISKEAKFKTIIFWGYRKSTENDFTVDSGSIWIVRTSRNIKTTGVHLVKQENGILDIVR